MSEWQRGAIGELAKGYRGVTYSAGQLREFKAHDTVTLLRSNNISGGQLNFGDVQIVSERLVSDDQILTPGDIAVCMSNGSKALVGKSAQLVAASDERFTVGAFCSVFRPQPSANSRFVAYAFQSSSYRSNLDLALAGTAINNLRNVDVEAFACDIPPYEEQSRIAQILNTLDTAIRETEVLIDKLKAVKQGMLHDLLTRGIDANGQLRPPQSEAPQLYKESPLGWIPREWGAVELNQLIDQKRQVVYGILMPGYGHPGGVPVVKVKDIFDGKIHLNDLLLTSPQIDREYNRSRLKEGDLLFTIRGTVGRTAFVPPALDSANITQDTARLAVTGTDARFLRAYLGMPVPSRFIATHTLGVAVQGINLRDVRRIPIARPSALEAKAIADKIQSQERRLESERLSVAKLRLAKAGLMNDLLTGRVRVTPLLESVQQAAAQIVQQPVGQTGT